MKKLFILFIFFSCDLATSQTNEVRSYTIEDGLPQSQVYAIAQDSIGYLWLGTQGGGIAKFDGDDFTVYNEGNGLTSNYIESLLVLGNQLFIGTKKGLSVLTKNKFTPFISPQINALYHHEGIVYAATASGIYSYVSDEGFQKIALSEEVNTAFINDVLYDGSHFWIAANSGLYKTKSLFQRSPISILETLPFPSLAKYGDYVFAASFADGILVYDISEKQRQRVVLAQPLQIQSLAILEEQLWVCTNQGVTIIDAKSLQFQKSIGSQNGLTVSHVRESFMDRQGNVWLGTSGGGLYHYFPNEFTHFDRDTGLPGNRIYAAEATKNKIWFSVSENGLVYIDSLGIHKLPKIEGLEGVKIKTITSDANENIWAGSEGKGLLYRHTKTYDSIIVRGKNFMSMVFETVVISKTQNFVLTTKDGLPSDWIRSVLVRNDTIWVATYSSGIAKLTFDIQQKKAIIHKVFNDKDGIQELSIRDISFDANGRLWYSTLSGQIGNIKDNTVTHLGRIVKVSTPINTLLFRDNTLFLGTADSGIWYSTDVNYSKFVPLKGAKQASSKNSYQLIFDGEGNLWTGSERGVDKLVLNTKNELIDVFHYGRNDGFLGIETCLNAVTRDADGNLWFGAIYGFTKYDASKNSTEKIVVPSIAFEEVRVGYKLLDSINDLKWKGKKLQLTPEENQVSFSYRSVDLNHPNTVQYRYKLDEKKWSPWSKINQQSFPELTFGDHTFSAQSRNYRWQESTPVSFNFYIETPLFKKDWFQWLSAFILVSLILIIVIKYIKTIKKRNAETQQQLQLENHLLTLEQKALRLQMNPHFIFNVLNGIKAMGTSDTKKMNTTINSFANLLRGILNNSRKDTISLSQEIETLKNYIEVEQLMAQKSFEFSIKTEIEMDAEEILIPPMLIQPFVENAIRHGILKSNTEGKLTVRFKTDVPFLHCIVIDNGPGIYHSQQNKTTTSHQSVGLDVTRERIESLSGKGSLNIQELKENTTIVGTKVEFRIPLETDF